MNVTNWSPGLAGHVFEGGGNDFLCSVCERPRALHQRYPFTPRPDREEWFAKPYVSYRGHKYLEDRHPEGGGTRGVQGQSPIHCRGEVG